MKIPHCPSILVPLLLSLVSPALAAEDTCADRSIVAGAVRTLQDAKTLTQCAYEFVHEVGFEEARRAFNEDERWKSGPTYVFVSEVTPLSDQARLFVFPPARHREGGLAWTADRCLRQRLLQGAAPYRERIRRGLHLLLLPQPGYGQGRAQGDLHQEHRLAWVTRLPLA